MVLVVPSVQVHVVGVKQEVGKQQHDHFDGIFPAIYKVPVKHVRRLRRRKAILNGQTGVTLLKFYLVMFVRAKLSDKDLQPNLYLIEYEK